MYQVWKVLLKEECSRVPRTKARDIKYIFILCGFQSSSDRSLLKHNELKHGEKSQTSEYKLEIEKCDITFSIESNLNRHKRENHYESKVNFDFVEDLDSVTIIKCEVCDQTLREMQI